MKKKFLVVFIIGLLLFCMSGLTQATPITGDPVGNSFGWSPNSTNALNYTQQVPGRIGQIAPYVLFNTNDIGSVTLDFYNQAPGLAFFEIRIDGVATGATSHPVVTGDTIHTGGKALSSGSNLLGEQFFATNYVDVRLALGGERDWDFDWTRFETAPVPEPATMLLFGLGILGLAGVSKKKLKR